MNDLVSLEFFIILQPIRLRKIKRKFHDAHNTVTKYERPIKFVVLIRTTNQLIRDCIIACHGILTQISVFRILDSTGGYKKTRR